MGWQVGERTAKDASRSSPHNLLTTQCTCPDIILCTHLLRRLVGQQRRIARGLGISGLRLHLRQAHALRLALLLCSTQLRRRLLHTLLQAAKLGQCCLALACVGLLCRRTLRLKLLHRTSQLLLSGRQPCLTFGHVSRSRSLPLLQRRRSIGHAPLLGSGSSPRCCRVLARCPDVGGCRLHRGLSLRQRGLVLDEALLALQVLGGHLLSGARLGLALLERPRDFRHLRGVWWWWQGGAWVLGDGDGATAGSGARPGCFLSAAYCTALKSPLHLRLKLALARRQLCVTVHQAPPLLLQRRSPRFQRRSPTFQRILVCTHRRCCSLALGCQALLLRGGLALECGAGGGALPAVPLLLRALRRLERLQARLRALQVGSGCLQLSLAGRHLHLERLGGAARLRHLCGQRVALLAQPSHLGLHRAPG